MNIIISYGPIIYSYNIYIYSHIKKYIFDQSTETEYIQKNVFFRKKCAGRDKKKSNDVK